MKLPVLLSFCLLLSFSSHAQSLSWLHGEWTGETYFPNGPITKRIIVKLRITQITGNHFEALVDNFYPGDTTVRLERKITGTIINKEMQVESSRQIYIRDPRTQSFWPDCGGCALQSAFSIGDKKVEININTLDCGDACNSQTTFSRDTSDLDAEQHKDLAKWFHLPAVSPVVKAEKKPTDSIVSGNRKQVLSQKKDTLLRQKDTLPAEVSPVKRKTTGEENMATVKPSKHDSPVTKKTGSPAVIAPSKNTSRLASENELLTDKKANAVVRTKDSLAENIPPKKDSIPNALTIRTTNLVTTFRVTSPHIVIQLFDNAEIDGDVVTVYHNGQLIANHQSLTHKAITISIDASKTDAHHEFVMVADNLGLIAPNTALMRITAGAQKFELEVSSDFYNNSKIAIDYTGE